MSARIAVGPALHARLSRHGRDAGEYPQHHLPHGLDRHLPVADQRDQPCQITVSYPAYGIPDGAASELDHLLSGVAAGATGKIAGQTLAACR